MERYARALNVYTEIVDEIALRSRPAGRDAYLRAARDAADLAARPPEDPPLGVSGEDLAARLLDILGRLDLARRSLDAGAAAALDPTLLEEATRRMSRTYAEGSGAKAARVRDAQKEADVAAQTQGAAVTATWGARLAENASPEAVARVFYQAPRTPHGAELYAVALEGWLARGLDVAASVEGAKDYALGIAPDTAAAVAAAEVARAGLHPLQAMEITFGLVPDAAAESAADGAAVVSLDLTLPQAGTAVRYDIGPLIDARRAAQHGPLASMNSGLNFRLVERLRTITETPLGPVASGHAAPGVTIAEGGASRVVRTIDRGATFDALRGAEEPRRYATVGAGPPPRVERLGELLEEAVFGPPCGDAAGVRTVADTLVADYDARSDELAPDFTLDELVQRLATQFAAEYDAMPPATAEEFADAVLGQRGSRDIYRTYIARAIAEASKQGADRQLLRSEASGGTAAALFGSRGLGARGSRQEILLTQVTNLRASIHTAQRKLIGAYHRLGGPPRVLAILSETAPDTARRQRVLKLYREIADEALLAGRRPGRTRAAKAVEKGDSVEPRPSLKLYALEHAVADHPPT